MTLAISVHTTHKCDSAKWKKTGLVFSCERVDNKKHQRVYLASSFLMCLMSEKYTNITNV